LNCLLSVLASAKNVPQSGTLLAATLPNTCEQGAIMTNYYPPIGDSTPLPEERREPPIPAQTPEGEPPPPHEPDDPHPNDEPTIGDPFSSPTTIGDPPGGSGGMQV
jgi:hypothetical protein